MQEQHQDHLEKSAQTQKLLDDLEEKKLQVYFYIDILSNYSIYYL